MSTKAHSTLSPYTGTLMGIGLIALWLLSTTFCLNFNVDPRNPLLYLLVVLQMHLYTGLFITAHDAMHGTVSPNKQTNTLIGWICCLCYAFFFYSKLYSKHHEHHRYVHTEKDPDYSSGNFFVWYLRFFLQYFTWYQYLFLNLIFFFLNRVVHIAQANLILFWIVPSVLSSLQLFYFGTYRPHQGNPGNIHYSRSQKKNHLLAFFSCYFFGYHYEHHHNPQVPWWSLYKQK